MVGKRVDQIQRTDAGPIFQMTFLSLVSLKLTKDEWFNNKLQVEICPKFIWNIKIRKGSGNFRFIIKLRNIEYQALAYACVLKLICNMWGGVVYQYI